MRPHVVVVLPPGFDDYSRVAQLLLLPRKSYTSLYRAYSTAHIRSPAYGTEAAALALLRANISAIVITRPSLLLIWWT